MDRYNQIRVLGKGSFGSAWLVSLKKDPSVKYVAKEVRLMGMKPAEKAAAKHEINLLQKLNHPNIVRYIDHFEHRGSLYIVMEYADGGDLYAKIKARRGARFSENDVMMYFVQLCLALFHMHAKHIMHRDLKSQNTFLMSSGQVKLGDFGISAILQHTYELRKTVVGTPYYFSPELVKSQPYNNKSDIWAMGVILYELATLNHAFTGRSMAELSKNILRGRYEPISSSYSRDLRDLIASCLQVEPAKRPHIQAIISLPFVRKHIAMAQQRFSSNLGQASNAAAADRPSAGPSGGGMVKINQKIKDSNDVLLGIAEANAAANKKPAAGAGAGAAGISVDDFNKNNDAFQETLNASTATLDEVALAEDIINNIAGGNQNQQPPAGNDRLRLEMEAELADRMQKQNNFNIDYKDNVNKVMGRGGGGRNNNQQNPNQNPLVALQDKYGKNNNGNNKKNNNKNNNNAVNKPSRIAHWAGADNNIVKNNNGGGGGIIGGGIGGHVDRFQPKNNYDNVYNVQKHQNGGVNNPYGMNNQLYQEYLKKQEELKRLYGIPDPAGGGGNNNNNVNNNRFNNNNNNQNAAAKNNMRANPYFYGAVAAQAQAGGAGGGRNNYWNNNAANNGRVQAKFAGMGAFDRY